MLASLFDHTDTSHIKDIYITTSLVITDYVMKHELRSISN